MVPPCVRSEHRAHSMSQPQSQQRVRTSQALPIRISYVTLSKGKGSTIPQKHRSSVPSSERCKHGAGNLSFRMVACQRSLTDSDVSTAPSETESVSDEVSESGLSVQTTAAGGLLAGAHSPYCPHVQYKLTAGACTQKGWKRRRPNCPNQDVQLVVPISSNLMLVGMFDGHGRDGHRSASCVRDLFAHNAKILASLSGTALIEEFRRLFRCAQATLEEHGLAHYSGTTATVAVVDTIAGLVFVAHVGDSSLVVLKGLEVMGATKDHRVDANAEYRVIAHGGEVRTGMVGDTKTRRIYAQGSEFPGLAMARCLGDQEAQRLGASHDPEFNFLPFCSQSTLVVASDGVWDMLLPHEVGSLTANAAVGAGPASPAGGEEIVGTLANMIVTEARSRYSTATDIDDISAVVVRAMP